MVVYQEANTLLTDQHPSSDNHSSNITTYQRITLEKNYTHMLVEKDKQSTGKNKNALTIDMC